ncbi:MAG TPA: glycosyltransferase [Planctomycetaceae bacterium]|nr:glycosyltransferase [Planctomycetaceae bacterium]
MKIILVTETFGPKGFGVGKVLNGLVKLYGCNQVTYKILAPFVDDPENLLAEHENALVPYWEHKFLWHPKQQEFFEEEISYFAPDLIHIHGVFTNIQHSVVKAAIDTSVPLLLSSHGMLAPWLWQRHSYSYSFVKRLYWNLWMKPVLRKVSYIHAITKIEATHLKQEFPAIPQILIPNVIDLNQIAEPSEKQSPEKFFVFLGRLHPVKGVDLLIRAYYQAHLGDSWQLVIAGPDFNPTYGQELRQLVVKLGLSDHVDFIGPVYGRQKYALLSKAWGAVVPSYSEVVALVNLEAAAVLTPTITTTGTGLHDWAESGGLLIETDIDSLTKALQSAAAWPLDERLRRGTQARAFVQERYSWQAVGPRWIKAYQKIASEELG